MNRSLLRTYPLTKRKVKKLLPLSHRPLTTPVRRLRTHLLSNDRLHVDYKGSLKKFNQENAQERTFFVSPIFRLNNRSNNAVLNRLKGAKKMSTMQKSHLDWKKFKETNDLEDELKLQTKDGYGCLNLLIYNCCKIYILLLSIHAPQSISYLGTWRSNLSWNARTFGSFIGRNPLEIESVGKSRKNSCSPTFVDFRVPRRLC